LALGIVTQRRFLGSDDLAQLVQQAEALAVQMKATAGRGKVVMMGVDFGSFAGAMASALDLVSKSILLNANTGIGMAFSIDWVAASCRAAGPDT
jgi:hypothetical protein